MITPRITLCLVFAAALALSAPPASAVPTLYAPDAWTRGNNANTAYFGWDFLEHMGDPDLGELWTLDDGTPDLGTGNTAGPARIYQGVNGLDDPSPDMQGHVSSTHNYYSFTETFDAKITATAPASGLGGFTTVVLQLHSSIGGDSLNDLVFGMSDPTFMTPWTPRKHLNDTNAAGLGFHWLEWTAPGAHLPFLISITSFLAHRPVDSFEVDTFWSPTAPVVNSIAHVPEPATWLLALISLGALLSARRVR